MADNFDMKKFLAENKLGAYSRLKTEGEAAYEYEKGKEAGEKLAKEDMGKDIEDTKADFLAEEEPLNEDASAFAELLGTLAGVAGIALTSYQIMRAQNALEKENPELHKQLQNISGTISAADPSKNLEEKEEKEEGYMGTQYDSSEDMAVDMLKKGITEASPEAMDRMDGLVPQTALKALIGGSQAIIRDLKDDGFDDEDIFDFIMSKIKTLG